MRLTPHCYAVTGLGYSSPWCVNAGFIAGEEDTLVIDAGGNALAAQTLHGYATAVRPNNRLILLNTEKHFDHIGGNSVFHDLGVEIWAHPDCFRTETEFRAEIAEMNAGIANPVRRAEGEASAFFAGTRLISATREAGEGTVFHLGGVRVQILATPGHTATNLSVWVAVERVLYTGDTIVTGYLPNLDAGGVDDWMLWLESLNRIDALNPEVIVPGHGQIVRGPEITEALTRTRQILKDAIVEGRSPTAS
jgi:glyoxylase-like metal-dependent hydrolase (beta-lactamase superfamily II)